MSAEGERSGSRILSHDVEVTVIVPVRRINDYVRESLPFVLAQSGTSLEWICLPDAYDPVDDGIRDDGNTVRILPTGPVGPAEKRDIGAKVARGRLLAFLDDDAYPSADWLSRVLPHFDDDTVAAVGGPGVTPPNDGFWKQASGWALASRLGSGGARDRYLPVGGVKDVDDWPSMNLIVRASDFQSVGGFDCKYFPGEDTKLCLELVHRLGKRIVYEPAAVVFHHRRDLFWGHFRQVGRYGEHRGHFVRAYPETSRRPVYFAPTVLLLTVLTYPLVARLAPGLARPVRAAIGAYLFLLAATVVEITLAVGSIRLGLASAIGVAMTHGWYGTKFVLGLLRPPTIIAKGRS